MTKITWAVAGLALNAAHEANPVSDTSTRASWPVASLVAAPPCKRGR